MNAAPTIVYFIILGLLGGVARVLMWSKNWEEVKQYSSVRHMILGGIIGYLYQFLYSDYAFPNFVMTFVAGYMGADFIEGIIEKVRKKE